MPRAPINSVVSVDTGEINSIDHKERLSGYPKEALVDEVLESWDALAKKEAAMDDMVLDIKKLEVKIAKLSAVRGISSTKVEMNERIKELEDKLRSQQDNTDNNIVTELERRIEVLLTALFDLEREVSSLKDDARQ